MSVNGEVGPIFEGRGEWMDADDLIGILRREFGQDSQEDL